MTTSGLQVGSNSLTATYSGDANFLPSTSAPLNHVVACTTNLTGTINGGLTVTGSTCLTNARVNGATTVRPGAALSVSNSTLNGSLTSTNAAAITICASTVGHGATSIVGTTGFVLLGDNGDDGTPACAGNQFAGSFTLNANTGQAEVGGNTFRGSLTINNTSGVGPDLETTATEIEGNTITGSLSCTGNVPPPTNDGQPNNVNGSRLGQCAATTSNHHPDPGSAAAVTSNHDIHPGNNGCGVLAGYVRSDVDRRVWIEPPTTGRVRGDHHGPVSGAAQHRANTGRLDGHDLVRQPRAHPDAFAG